MRMLSTYKPYFKSQDYGEYPCLILSTRDEAFSISTLSMCVRGFVCSFVFEDIMHRIRNSYSYFIY